VQVQVLGLQSVYGGHCCTTTWRSEAWQSGVGSGEDVVNTEFNLRFWFILLVWVEGGVVTLSVVRADGAEAEGVRVGVRIGPPGRATLLVVDVVIVVVVYWEERLPRLSETHFHVASAPATPKVAVLEEVKHGLTASGECPVVAFPLLVSLRTGNLKNIYV
jgi:hypothetical protein